MLVGRNQNQLPYKQLVHLHKNNLTCNNNTVTICSECLGGIISVSINTPGSNRGTQISKCFGRFRVLGGFNKIADGTKLIAQTFHMFLGVSEEFDLKFRV